jgi:hypothetical protein
MDLLQRLITSITKSSDGATAEAAVPAKKELVAVDAVHLLRELVAADAVHLLEDVVVEDKPNHHLPLRGVTGKPLHLRMKGRRKKLPTSLIRIKCISFIHTIPFLRKYRERYHRQCL